MFYIDLLCKNKEKIEINQIEGLFGSGWTGTLAEGLFQSVQGEGGRGSVVTGFPFGSDSEPVGYGRGHDKLMGCLADSFCH